MSSSNGAPSGAPESPSVQILRLECGRPPLVVRCLGDLYGCLTHWTTEGSAYCLGDGVCPRQTHGKPFTWKGYVPILVESPKNGLWYAMVLEVTENLFNETLRDVDLVGLELEVWRVAERKNKKPVYGRVSQRIDPTLLPKKHDIFGPLTYIYRTHDFLESIPCPMAPKMRIEPVALPASARTVASPEPVAQKQGPTLRQVFDSARRNGH